MALLGNVVVSDLRFVVAAVVVGDLVVCSSVAVDAVVVVVVVVVASVAAVIGIRPTHVTHQLFLLFVYFSLHSKSKQEQKR